MLKKEFRIDETLLFFKNAQILIITKDKIIKFQVSSFVNCKNGYS